jgi:hypothetical protein
MVHAVRFGDDSWFADERLAPSGALKVSEATLPSLNEFAAQLPLREVAPLQTLKVFPV